MAISPMIFQDAQRSQQAARPAAATFRTWCFRARPGGRLEYYRGYLKESDRRKLVAVADHALALAGRKRQHLLQGRHADRDSSYWAGAKAPVRGGQA